jgi:hypothetical protein
LYLQGFRSYFVWKGVQNQSENESESDSEAEIAALILEQFRFTVKLHDIRALIFFRPKRSDEGASALDFILVLILCLDLFGESDSEAEIAALILEQFRFTVKLHDIRALIFL